MSIPSKNNQIRNRAHRTALIFFAIISIVILYFSWKVIAPFATPILLAAVIATFSYPLYESLTKSLNGKRHIASWLMCLLVTLIIVMPLFILTLFIIQQASIVLEKVTPSNIIPFLEALHIDRVELWLKDLIPGLDFGKFDIEGSVVELAKIIPGAIVGLSGTVLSQTVNLLLGFFLMIITLSYFYTEGPSIIEQLLYLSPLPDTYDLELFQKFKSIVHATLKGSFLTGLAQGIVTTIGFAVVGIPAAAFWGVVAIIFSFLPMIGTALVWVPGVIYLAISYLAGASSVALWQPIFLGIWGITLISSVDNIMRPFVMNTDTDMPTIVLFFSILGGVKVFGFIGILLGPLLFALLATLLHIYKHYFHSVLREQNRDPRIRKIPKFAGNKENPQTTKA